MAAWTKTYDGAEPVRINKWLALEGVCSRREADALIGQGLVEIDGKAVTELGERIVPGQTIKLNSKAAQKLDNQLSIVLNKPVGYVSGTPEPGETPAIRLITKATLKGEAHAIPGRNNKMAPLGRLDKDSRGLLILSEDGVLAKAIIGPLSGVDKEYIVRVLGEITPEKLALLRHGLELDGRKLRPAKVTAEGKDRLRFILNEGRNRQIRRMCSLVHLRVVDLQRIRVGPVELGNLPEGKWRPLSHKERAALIAASVGKAAEAKTAPKKPAPGPKARKSSTGKSQEVPSELAPKVPYRTRSYGLTGEGFRRTKLPPRPRRPIK
ncbi:MAG: rRNA pseudouridine synthase [Hyphomonas sp.]|jgi:23S rRNA pseudouridine2604 synthase|nr:rRNA pseudouridine synthase [Hyphomonas sp.]